MGSRDTIYFPCWDKSKAAILEFWELHQINKEERCLWLWESTGLLGW